MRGDKVRYALLLIGVALLVILVYVDIGGDFFLKEFKERAHVLIRDKIGLEGKIGDIEGGIFREIILKDIVLYQSPSPESTTCPAKEPPLFSSTAITLDYKLWDIALKRFDKLSRITFISPKIYFANLKNKFPVPKMIEPAWKEITVSIRDGSFYDGISSPVISELNGNFKISEDGIESKDVSAKVLNQRLIGSGRFGFPIASSAIKLEGAIKGKGYVLKAQLNGAINKLFVRGSFDVLKKMNLNFVGNIVASENAISFKNFNFGKNFILYGMFEPANRGLDLSIYPKNNGGKGRGNSAVLGEVSKVGIKGDFSSFPYFTLNINADHLKLYGFDLLSNYNVKGKFNYSEENRLNSIIGELATSCSIINYSPIRELKGNYEVVDNKIKLKAVNYGDVASANGVVSLIPPNEVDLYIKFKGTQLGSLTDLTLGKGMMSGLAFGDIHFYGDLSSGLKMDGQLEFLNGNISVIKFDSAKVNLKGDGTVIELVNSKVYSQGAALDLEGRIELKEIGTPKAFKDIQLRSDPRTVVLAGVDLIKGLEDENIVIGKDIGEQFRVNFKAYASGDLSEERPKSDEMELEYKLGGPKSIKLKLKEDEDFFGVEHKVRF